jgi:hypothetical protein
LPPELLSELATVLLNPVSAVLVPYSMLVALAVPAIVNAANPIMDMAWAKRFRIIFCVCSPIVSFYNCQAALVARQSEHGMRMPKPSETLSFGPMRFNCLYLLSGGVLP